MRTAVERCKEALQGMDNKDEGLEKHMTALIRQHPNMWRTMLQQGDMANVEPMTVALKQGGRPRYTKARPIGQEQSRVLDAYLGAGLQSDYLRKPQQPARIAWGSPICIVTRKQPTEIPQNQVASLQGNKNIEIKKGRRPPPGRTN
eukprot:GHVU01001987.1.p1 GENE.GHVU01001987.1~~GHVU01001987.1.p1  ORF type:complete len:163 (+),score=28.14 GHVU01001987.1:53-490(+)